MANPAYYAGQGSGINDWGSFTATTLLPNVSGATVQSGALAQYDRATVVGVTYICTTPTLGAAIWSVIVPQDAFGLDIIQVVSTASATINGNTTFVSVTYAAGAVTLVLPTVAAGAPIGRRLVIVKSNTSANGITITPDTGASINGAAANATQAMVGLNNTASTTVSAAATNDICAVFRRDGALSWRSCAA